MLGVALAEVLRAPGRTALRSLTIGGAIAVILLFEGFRAGIGRQMWVGKLLTWRAAAPNSCPPSE